MSDSAESNVAVETVELSLSHVGLGSLTEGALLRIFATAQAHRMMAGTGAVARDIFDRDGTRLYPSYYWTHLTVPPTRLLASFSVWDRVSVGVDVRRYGRLILDSRYIVGGPGEPFEDAARWSSASLPSMRGGNLFVVESTSTEPAISAPRAGSLASMPSLASAPAAIDAFRKARAARGFQHALSENLGPAETVSRLVVPDRDCARGHAVMFAAYGEFMDDAERIMLADPARTGLPPELVDCRAVLERETFYFGRCFAGDVVDLRLRARLEPAPPDLFGAAADLVPAAALRCSIDLSDHRTGALLAVSRAHKVFAVPPSQSSLVSDAQRVLRELGD